MANPANQSPSSSARNALTLSSTEGAAAAAGAAGAARACCCIARGTRPKPDADGGGLARGRGAAACSRRTRTEAGTSAVTAARWFGKQRTGSRSGGAQAQARGLHRALGARSPSKLRRCCPLTSLVLVRPGQRHRRRLAANHGAAAARLALLLLMLLLLAVIVHPARRRRVPGRRHAHIGRARDDATGRWPCAAAEVGRQRPAMGWLRGGGAMHGAVHMRSGCQPPHQVLLSRGMP